MSKKRTPVEQQLCRNCIHAVPVTNEYLTPDGSPIFCTCEYSRHYNFLNYREEKRKNCDHYETNNH